ncbi:MAG: hypothetical protein ACREGC_03095, partial [Minisyncoccia bacterium]
HPPEGCVLPLDDPAAPNAKQRQFLLHKTGLKAKQFAFNSHHTTIWQYYPFTIPQKRLFFKSLV